MPVCNNFNSFFEFKRLIISQFENQAVCYKMLKVNYIWTILTPRRKEEVRSRRNEVALEICQGNKADVVLPLAPICEEPHTKVQLTVPLREITLKKPIFSPLSHARSWTRVHVWQLHVDILPAAYSELHRTGGRKGKSGGSHLTIRAAASPQTDTDRSENWHLHCGSVRGLRCPLIAFCFLHFMIKILAPRVGLQLVPFCVYLHQVQYD